MRETRILLHYLKRVSGGSQNVVYFRRLSVLRAQIQKQTRVYANSFTTKIAIQSPIIRQRISQSLGLSYYKRLITPSSSAAAAIFSSASSKLGNPEFLVCSSNTNKDNDAAEQFERRKERLQRANKRIREQSQIIIKDIKETKEHLRQRVDDIIAKENIYTIPNLLCVLRIGMTPILGYMIVHQQYAPAIGIFAFAGITDLLDGYIARVVPGQASVMGSFLDPMADKILVGVMFLSLTYMNLIPVPLTALIIARDSVLIGSGFYIRYKSLEPPRTLSRYFDLAHPTAQLSPTFLSKVNTGIQLGLVGATLISTVLPYDVSSFLYGLWWCTAATTVGSGVTYMFAKNTFKLLRKPKQHDSSQSNIKDKTS